VIAWSTSGMRLIYLAESSGETPSLPGPSLIFQPGLIRVIWAGERDDMPATYNALDVVCSSSITEGAPFAIAEAMACGVSCVVTDVGDSGSLVGDSGLVVPPANPEALARGLQLHQAFAIRREPGSQVAHQGALCRQHAKGSD
jgi:glycosyltransferase involved in cell wall biosynthesis